MSDATREILEARSAAGKPVSFIDDCPDIPLDVAHIYRAFAELRSSTPADEPISYTDKLAAWESFGQEEFTLFSQFVGALDDVFLKRQAERMKKEMAKKPADAATRRAERKAPIGSQARK